MFPIQPKHVPTLIESILIFFIAVGLISYFIIGLGTVPHIPILIGIFVIMAYGLLRKISFADLQNGMVEGAKTGMGAVFLFFLIGILISSWMMSGTIPALINSGFTLVGGTWFYAIVFALTAIIGVSMGSSLTTTATIGVAFIGMATAMDVSLAITAGAIVSGAFFGDKMSPLSDTTNLSSTVVGVDLFDHIKHISLTTIPAFILSFIVFAILSPSEAITMSSASDYKAALAETGLIHWASWIPLVILILCTAFRIPAFVSLGVSSLVATGVALISGNVVFADVWGMWFDGFTATTGFEPVNALLTKGALIACCSPSPL
ncbi:Arginine/ornithine antiporter ArcD [Lentibacillus sp. JNUCC-1]|nr:Arginine/ornithine antiporter ArcD [Lentibacillus sp. JNUCC-1]